jgi:DNA-binding MarR family transcriptional regulator
MQTLWALVHALEVRSKRMARTIGVTGPQRLVLRIVGRHPASTAGEIAEILELHASTLSGILARLEHAGMITRRVDARDRRRARFTLTAAGKRVDRERKGTAEAAVRRALKRAPPREAAACAALLRLVIDELQRDD